MLHPFVFIRTSFIRTLRLKFKNRQRTLHGLQSQLRTFLLRPNVFKMNSINTDKIIQVKIQSILSN